MRAVVQRVSRASVRVEGATVAEIQNGLLVFVGVGVDDNDTDAVAMAAKVATLRIFCDAEGLMNCSIKETNGAVLLVSQFTLHGDVRRGRRPSFLTAAPESSARPLYHLVGHSLAAGGVAVAYGKFGAHMEVELLNDGPVTILIDTKRAF